ncbi:expressed protein [Echinococcus multilocularis]|uniref:Expressed protein n=1 Tax=Echinococcus multilocularis TaxID=6211 RepID=A0A087VYL3_ECHMU|nr:expressed protein [Echinococcus multilocularis]
MLPFSPKPAGDQAEHFPDVIEIVRQTSNTKQNQVGFWHLLPFCSQRLLAGKVSCLWEEVQSNGTITYLKQVKIKAIKVAIAK